MEMVRVLWNEREDRKLKEERMEQEIQQNHQVIQQLQIKLNQVEEDYHIIRKERLENIDTLKAREKTIRELEAKMMLIEKSEGDRSIDY